MVYITVSKVKIREAFLTSAVSVDLGKERGWWGWSRCSLAAEVVVPLGRLALGKVEEIMQGRNWPV